MATSSALQAFFEESDTHIETIESSLLALEHKNDDADIINELFRAVHSLKGNAGLVGLLDIHEVATDMETVLEQLRKEKKAVEQADRDMLFTHLDKLKELVEKAGEESGKTKEEEDAKTPPAPKIQGKPSADPTSTAKEQVASKTSDKSGPSSRKKMSFLTFSLGNEEYGLDIISVREIILQRHTTRVPNTKSFVTGIMNLRGMVIPVINARKKLGCGGSSEKDDAGNIIIVEEDGVSTGVLVDMVKDIVTIDENDIVTSDSALRGLQAEFIYGIGKTEKSNLIIINVKRFCDVREKYY